MKLFKMTVLSLAFATSAASLSTMAAETAQISVKGSIVPTACSISVDGSVDFGNLKESELKEKPKEQNAYQLGYKPVNFNIQCNSAAKVAVSAQADTPVVKAITTGVVSYVNDNDKTTRNDVGQLASLGTVEDKTIGYYTVALASATLDSKDSELLSSQDNGSNWAAVANLDDHLMYQDGSVLHSWGTDTPLGASNIAGVINISAAISPDVVENMKDTISFNTNTTLSLQYL
jgi:type 1 fimbria pilin